MKQKTLNFGYKDDHSVKNLYKSTCNEVAINFIRRYGLLGALFACPDSTFWGTFILIGRSMKNKIHQTRIKIRTWVNSAIKIVLNELQFLVFFELNFL